ncbi:hypothetical protein, partial [Chamaesiphon sp. OTE_8_metabat_110]
NSHVKSTNILDRIQFHFDSLARSLSIGRIDLSKIGIHWSIFIHTSHPRVVAELKPDDATVTPSDSAKRTLRDRGNTGNRQLQKPQLARRHHSLNWRWQSQLMQWH